MWGLSFLPHTFCLADVKDRDHGKRHGLGDEKEPIIQGIVRTVAIVILHVSVGTFVMYPGCPVRNRVGIAKAMP
jgi:hypothetical protein